MTYKIEWSRVTNSSGPPPFPSKINVKQWWMSGGSLSSKSRPSLLKEEETCSLVCTETRVSCGTGFWFGKKGPGHLRWHNGWYSELIWIFLRIPIPKSHSLKRSNIFFKYYYLDFKPQRTARKLDYIYVLKLNPSGRGDWFVFLSISHWGLCAATY